MSFAGKTVWITGASSGIGEGLAKAFARDGAAVVLSGRREAELARVAATITAETLVLPFEATDYDALPAAVARAEGWRGGIDVLVNNAGISQRSLALDTGFDVYRRLMEVDFFAPLRLTQLVLLAMVARRSGQIAAVSSVAGKVGSPLRTGYCAAKHAVVGYFDALRAEVEGHGVKVSVITPGFIRTAIATNAVQGDGSTRGYSDDNIDGGMGADAAAEAIVAAMARGQREIPVGIGAEMGALDLRRFDPERLFDAMAEEGKRLAGAAPISSS